MEIPKPCPFCGFALREHLERISKITTESEDCYPCVKCPNCGACGPDWNCDYMAPTQTKEEAFEVWNKRV